MGSTKSFLGVESLWSGLDVEALLEGTKGRSRGALFDERQDKAIPAHLRPEVKGMPALRQIDVILGAYAIWSGRRTPSDDDSPERLRTKRIAKIYADLRAAGYMLDDVAGLKTKHFEAWLELLRSRGYAYGTIREQWYRLRMWAYALGKPDIVVPLETLWPDGPPQERSRKLSAAERHKQYHGDPRLHAELLRAKERTHWYIEQLCYRLKLTLDEAVRFSPAAAGDYGAGLMKVRTGCGDAVRVVAVPAQERLLVQEIVEFIFSEGRKSLAWPNMRPGDAARKHQQRLSYLRRKLQKEGVGEASRAETATQPGVREGCSPQNCAGGMA